MQCSHFLKITKRCESFAASKMEIRMGNWVLSITIAACVHVLYRMNSIVVVEGPITISNSNRTDLVTRSLFHLFITALVVG